MACTTRTFTQLLAAHSARCFGLFLDGWTSTHHFHIDITALYMAGARRTVDRLERKKDNSHLRMFISAFLLGNLDNTAECLVQQRQRRAQQHDEQQPGVSLGRAFGTRYPDGHRAGLTCRPPGQIETCLLAQVFPCANIDSEPWTAYSQKSRKSQKHDPGVGEDDRRSGNTMWRTLLLSFAFILLIRLLQTLCV